METPKHRVLISIELDADYHAFVEQFMAAGMCASRNEFFQLALDALAREIEASARAVASDEGISDADTGGLAELADALGALNRQSTGNSSH
jgi:hypothetical protein